MKLTPGKRYRWTVEGVAKDSETVGLMLAVNDYLGMVADLVDCGTLELLPDPLPTTPGSVVLTSGGITFVLTTTDEFWPWQDVTRSENKVNRDYFNGGYTVLFDAGAERA